MDKNLDINAIRAQLAGMTRAEVRELARTAGLACSTVEKFRLGHITEPRLSKLQKLRAALGRKPRTPSPEAVKQEA